MDTAKPQRRKHIPSTIMREKLIDAVIHLARTIPYSDINARRIADELSVDPKTIFRCFPTPVSYTHLTLPTILRV